MISFSEFKEIADTLGLEIAEDENNKEWNMYIDSPLFVDSHNRAIDGAVLALSFSNQAVWLYNRIEIVEYPWDNTPHWHLAAEIDDENLNGKKYVNKEKSYFIEEIRKIMVDVKNKQEEVELEKIKGDFQC